MWCGSLELRVSLHYGFTFACQIWPDCWMGVGIEAPKVEFGQMIHTAYSSAACRISSGGPAAYWVTPRRDGVGVYRWSGNLKRHTPIVRPSLVLFPFPSLICLLFLSSPLSSPPIPFHCPFPFLHFPSIPPSPSSLSVSSSSPSSLPSVSFSSPRLSFLSISSHSRFPSYFPPVLPLTTLHVSSPFSFYGRGAVATHGHPAGSETTLYCCFTFIVFL